MPITDVQENAARNRHQKMAVKLLLQQIHMADKNRPKLTRLLLLVSLLQLITDNEIS